MHDDPHCQVAVNLCGSTWVRGVRTDAAVKQGQQAAVEREVAVGLGTLTLVKGLTDAEKRVAWHVVGSHF